MLPKYTVEYIAQFKRHAQTNHYSTDDPVACEEFVGEILERGFVIRAIKHEGVDVSTKDFDRMVKTAAGMLASKRICASLGIKPFAANPKISLTLSANNIFDVDARRHSSFLKDFAPLAGRDLRATLRVGF